MTDVARITPVGAAQVQPATKRAGGSNAAVVAVVLADAKPAAKAETAKPVEPVEPVVQIEPSTYLTITKDETANTFVYRSVDAESGEVVWQYPVEQVLRMAHRLRELEGLEPHQVDRTV